ncbi:phage tail assembly chaperone [Burkholderia contaminans]|uniref:XkdW family protein n=1 Tax=Burkholderia contaminans TaxID=488447 RepID=UPI0026566188|nr:phage tail assembly chaperone [Burkholderia contaminans]MDN7790431.1 phage tail assembly chaperone [Burkholderia contaminans]
MKNGEIWLNVEQAAFILERKFPRLVRGVDYWPAHPVDEKTLVQSKTAWVPIWLPEGIPHPTPDDLLAWWPEFSDEYTSLESSESARKKRNELLAQADLLVELAKDDGNLDLEAALRDYRSKLRAVPEQEGFPFDVSWPVVPKG